ncbi:hypothetical protein [Helicobacter pylori]|uniref:hypothetical protein n=1 Tax=Helicobacter pylori TaxID=210 RepID=UPI0018846D95|nr:hypothetical protein [Helicobacter pylori]
MRLSYDFLELTDELLEYYPVLEGARWEKEALEQGLGNSFKPKKKKKTKARKKPKRKK